MISDEQIIANFEVKIKQLIAENNANHESGDMSREALYAYIENAEHIDRLKYAIAHYKNRQKEIADKAKENE